MSSVLALVVGILFVGVLFVFLRPKADPEKVAGFLERGALVLDVRTPGEFRRLHHKAARNIPVDELQKRIGELGEPGPIIVYCQSGMRSRRAAGMLQGAGFEVLDLGGIGAWPADQLEKRPNDASVS